MTERPPSEFILKMLYAMIDAKLLHAITYFSLAPLLLTAQAATLCKKYSRLFSCLMKMIDSHFIFISRPNNATSPSINIIFTFIYSQR